MDAYAIGVLGEVHDPDKLGQYREQVGPLVERMGGRYRVLSDQAEVVEGNWRPGVLVLIEFDTMEDLRAWYDAEEYQPMKRLRQEAAETDVVLVDGLS